MKLGQWVEFDCVIVRASTSQGSVVRTSQLPNVKRGMIIGKRAVYDAQGTFPPTLTNRRDVLLVATSMHKAYRVFPADAILSSGVSAAQASQDPSTIDVADSTDEREPASDAELHLWVVDAINARIAHQHWFTAYDITCDVRTTHVYDDIPHTQVRELVHEAMQHLISSNLYQTEAAQFGNDSAVRYLPV